jgi:metallophosphoesterase superfamily enzyme
MLNQGGTMKMANDNSFRILDSAFRIGEEWLLTAERVAVHLPTGVAIVADLHLGYAEARRRRGEAVPAECVAELLEPLGRVMRQQAARRLVIAGDLLEDGDCHDALTAFLEWLKQLDVELFALVPGNHDAGLEAVSVTRSLTLPIRREGVMLGGWRIVHGEGRLPDAPLVHGHEHPCLRWSPKKRAIRPRFLGSRIAPWAIEGPCYLTAAQRLILPAYSSEAAGVNILSQRRWRNFRCHVIAGDRVLDLGEVSTLRHRLSAAGST